MPGLLVPCRPRWYLGSRAAPRIAQAFIDTFSDAEQAVRDAEASLLEARENRDQQEALRATLELAGARIALFVLASADLLGPNEGAGTS
jgi:hypothetical protein